jgi:hypothetical protein
MKKKIKTNKNNQRKYYHSWIFASLFFYQNNTIFTFSYAK